MSTPHSLRHRNVYNCIYTIWLYHVVPQILGRNGYLEAWLMAVSSSQPSGAPAAPTLVIRSSCVIARVLFVQSPFGY